MTRGKAFSIAAFTKTVVTGNLLMGANNLYTFIHKGLRKVLCQQLVQLGQVNECHPIQLEQLLRDLQGVLVLMRSHLQHEDQFIHAVLPTDCLSAQEHTHHQHQIASLMADVSLLLQQPALGCTSALHELYRNFALFVADNLMHMEVEESQTMRLLWQHFNDDEIEQIHHRILNSLTPAERFQSLMLVLPALTHLERVSMVLQLKEALPDEAIHAVSKALQAELPITCWSALVQAVPALQCKNLAEAS